METAQKCETEQGLSRIRRCGELGVYGEAQEGRLDEGGSRTWCFISLVEGEWLITPCEPKEPERERKAILIFSLYKN